MMMMIPQAGLIAYWERWTVVDAFYYATITSTTVGYGDLHPTRDRYCHTWMDDDPGSTVASIIGGHWGMKGWVVDPFNQSNPICGTPAVSFHTYPYMSQVLWYGHLLYPCCGGGCR